MISTGETKETIACAECGKKITSIDFSIKGGASNESKRYHRSVLQTTAEDDPNLTEWQIRSEQGWNRIYDCGQTKWFWTTS